MHGRDGARPSRAWTPAFAGVTKMNIGDGVRALIIFFFILFSAFPLRAEEEPEADFTPAVSQPVDKGLAKLAAMQNADGSYAGGFPVANTALAGLAFVAGGHFPGRGAHGARVLKCV